jgi:hypothetical protein
MNETTRICYEKIDHAFVLRMFTNQRLIIVSWRVF